DGVVVGVGAGGGVSEMPVPVPAPVPVPEPVVSVGTVGGGLVGGGVAAVTTVKPSPFESPLAAITYTEPLEAFAGTRTWICVSDQETSAPCAPAKLTLPALLPNRAPLRVTTSPGVPWFGLRAVNDGTVGGAGTVVDGTPAPCARAPNSWVQ